MSAYVIRASVADLDAALPVVDVRSADEIVAASALPTLRATRANPLDALRITQ